MSITLGTVPEKLTVVVAKDADFFTTLKNSEGDWSPTAEIELRFGAIIWTASITDDLAVFNVDSVSVNALIVSKTKSAKLFYIDGVTEICWAVGRVDTSG